MTEPHEDMSLPPQLREALGVMAKRGPVVELTGRAAVDRQDDSGDSCTPDCDGADMCTGTVRGQR